MVRQGHLQVVNQVGRLAGDRPGLVVFAGHHKFRRLLADLLEDAVVPPLQQTVGVTAGLGLIAPLHDLPRQLAARIGGGRSRVRPAGVGGRTLTEEAAAGAGVAGHVAHLLDRQQQHVRVAVVAKAPQPLQMATGGALVPDLPA